jgi:hypothetical protein
MKFIDLNTAASLFNIEFALGYKSTGDLEAQRFFNAVSSDYSQKLQRVLHLYGIDRKLAQLEAKVEASGATVELGRDGYIEMHEGSQKVVFKMRPIDLYLSYFLGISPRHKYYQLLRFYLSFSPYLELFAFNEGAEKLQAKRQ